VARLLNAGMGAEETVFRVVEEVRSGLPADWVSIWFRDDVTGRFRVVAAPPRADAPPLDVLDMVPADESSVRILLNYEESPVGLLQAAVQPDANVDVFPVIGDLLALYLGTLAVSADFAVEVASQSREIDEQRRFTGLIIDSLPLGLYVVDRDYRIQIWNRQREMGAPGLRRDEVVGRQVFDVLTRQPADELRAEFDRVFQTGEIQQVELEVTLAGEPRIFRLTKIPMRLEGDDISHVITIGEDVTDSRRIQGQIMQSEKLAAVGQLAAGVMHEINNPLATISVSVAAISARLGELTGADKAAVEEYLELIDKEVDRCTRIVDGLLDFSRPKGKTKGKVILNALVDETLFLLKHHQRFKRLVVVRELDVKLPACLGNAEQLTQVLMALMLNAVDAMDDRGKLTVRTGRNSSRHDEVFVEIEDDGIGIPRADQSKIFEPFYTTKPPGRGTGLGLSICYGIVEDHRGRIEVDSQPGRGSIFRIFLPALP
jgi:two-component system, NtrC family, sensor kinase